MKKQWIVKLCLIAVLAFISFSHQSCLKEYSDLDKVSQNLDLNPSAAIAVANTKLTLRDLIRDYDNDELFEEGDNGLLYLMYNKEILTKTADELISLPNQTFPILDQFNQAAYDAITPVSGFRQFPIIPIHYNFLVSNQEQIDSVLFDAMDINIKVNSSFTVPGVLKMTFPSLLKNGQPFTSTVHPDLSGNFHYDLSTHIEGYTLILDVERVLVEFDLEMVDGTSNSGDVLDIQISLNDMDFCSIFGYVGKISTNIPQDTVNISIFDNAFAGSVYFQNPQLTLHIGNSFGLPITSYFGDLQTYSAINGGDWTTFDFPYDEVEIEHPSIMGETVFTDVVLNSSNFPQLGTLVSNQPKYLFFELNDVVINPDGYNQAFPNFVSDTSKVSVDLEVKLPMEGNAQYSLVDTVEMDLEKDFEDISEHFVEANIRSVFDNFMPTDVYLQVIFTDSLYFPLDTLFEGGSFGERLVDKAVVDVNGKAIQLSQKINNTVFTNGPGPGHDINDLKKVRNAIVIATIKTNTNGAVGEGALGVKLYGENYLEVRFGLKGVGKIEGTLD